MARAWEPALGAQNGRLVLVPSGVGDGSTGVTRTAPALRWSS